jgi:succinyl-diaminopimelate desuccinylase
MAVRGSTPLPVAGDVVTLLRELIDIASVSGNEQEIADRTEVSLDPYEHLEVIRDGNVVVARTDLGRP